MSRPKAVCASGLYYELKKSCITALGFRKSLVLPKQVGLNTRSGGYLGHGGEGIGGRNFSFDSLKSRLNRDFRLMWKDQTS